MLRLCSCQPIVRQSLGSLQAVFRQSSNSCQVFVRQLLGSLQAVLRLLSGGCYHVVVRQMSNCQTSVRFVIYWAAYGSERLFSLFLQCVEDFMWNCSGKYIQISFSKYFDPIVWGQWPRVEKKLKLKRQIGGHRQTIQWRLNVFYPHIFFNKCTLDLKQVPF